MCFLGENSATSGIPQYCVLNMLQRSIYIGNNIVNELLNLICAKDNET